MVRPRGRAGEVLLDRPVSRQYQMPLRARLGDADRTIENLWVHQDRAVVKFEGVNSIDEAEALRGLSVAIPREALEPGEYLYDDLVGCAVVDDKTGAPVGRVKDWHDNGPQVLLELEGGAMIPCVPEICVAVLPAERVIRVKLPEGLDEL